MQVERYDGDVNLTPNVSTNQILEALVDPENKTVTLHKEGSRTVYGGMVHKVQDGKFIKIGLSWQNTNETIKEHDEIPGKEEPEDNSVKMQKELEAIKKALYKHDKGI